MRKEPGRGLGVSGWGVGCQTHPSHLLSAASIREPEVKVTAAGYIYGSHTWPENLDAKLMEVEEGSVHLSFQMSPRERGQAYSYDKHWPGLGAPGFGKSSGMGGCSS